MASTVFRDYVTPVVADWLNDVNTAVYNDLPPLTGANFLAVEGGIINATDVFEAAAASSTLVEIPEGTYLLNRFPVYAGRTYRAKGVVNIQFRYTTAVVFLAMYNGCTYEDIHFESLESNLTNQRCSIEDVFNVHVKRCTFTGFRDTSTSNAWGILIARSSSILLDHCGFENNTQSDIAITDTVHDVVINNAYNFGESGVYLNIEPNTSDGMVGLVVNGGRYRQIDLLENENTGYASKGIVISGVRADLVRYDGSGVKFLNTHIGQIIPEGTALTTAFAGTLSIDTLDLKKNLLTDPYLFDVSPTDTTCFWTSYTSSGNTHQRILDQTDGKYARLNAAQANVQIILTTRTGIPVTPGETLLFFMRSRTINTTSHHDVGTAILQYFDSGASLLLETTIKCNRCAVGSTSDWNNNVATPKVPAGAATVKVRVTNGYLALSTALVDVATIGLFRFELLPTVGGGGNMDAVLGSMSVPQWGKTFYQEQIPVGTLGYSGCFVGERIVKTTPVVNSIDSWVCTAVPGAVGEPGTLIAESYLGALRGVTSAIGGGALLAGACSKSTVTISGATNAMSVSVSPESYPGDGVGWWAYVSSANTVTVVVTAIVATTPSPAVYHVTVHR